MKSLFAAVAVVLVLAAAGASAVVVVVPPDASPEPSAAPVPLVDPFSGGGAPEPSASAAPDPMAPAATIEVADENLVGVDRELAEVSASPSPAVTDPFGGPTDACEAAFADCNLRFRGLRDALPTFDITGPKGAPFTPRLVWRDDSRTVGLALSNWEGELLGAGGSARPFSAWATGAAPLSRSQFKAVPMLPGAPFAGVGHEAFQGNRGFAQGKCVRVRVSDYQLIDGADPPNVITNINGVEECVVFRTAA